MITSAIFADKKFAVLGLARSGMAVVEALVASGAKVLAWDNREEARNAVPDGVETADLLQADLTGYEAIVVSPGVPINTHPIRDVAAKYNLPLIGDIELFAMARPDLPEHKVVGITGTNGKSTTTALVHHILQEAGINSLMGGNIGLPIMGQKPLEPNGNGPATYVLELSSYQIDLTHGLDCDVAVLLNITPDHLDRYDNDFDKYVASKIRLFTMQSHDSKAVFVRDTPTVWDIERTGAAEIRAGETLGLGQPDESMTLPYDAPALQGPHNAANARAALAVARSLQLNEDVAITALKSFDGLAHRMEVIAQHDGITFINDSKATNPASTAPALAAYKNIHWIVGGLPKVNRLDECEPYFDRVKAAYVIGDAGPIFADLLSVHMTVERSEMLCSAVDAAFENAIAGDVILLSPACASFDQFRDFEARGDAFVAMVNRIMDHHKTEEACV